MFKYYHRDILDKPGNLHINMYSEWDNIVDMYNEQLSTLMEYYIERDIYVKNTHRLCRIIDLLDTSAYDNFDSYLSYVKYKFLDISKQLYITSISSTGETYKNEFFKDTNEYMYIGNHQVPYENEDYFHTNWRNIESVKYIYHESTDLDFYISNGTKILNPDSFIVTSIDIISLMLQYREWVIFRRLNNYSISPNIFIHSVVLVNMIKSFMDISIFNRYRNIIINKKCNEFYRVHPIAIIDQSNKIDNILKKIAITKTNTLSSLTEIYCNIPCLFTKDVFTLLQIHDLSLVSKNEWLFWLSRIFIIIDNFIMFGDLGIRKNTEIINHLRRELKRIDNGASRFENILPVELYRRFIFALDYLKQKE